MRVQRFASCASGLALTAALALVACAPATAGAPASTGASQAAPAAPAAPAPAKSQLGLATDTIGCAPLYVALRKGFFTDQNLEVERTLLQGDSPLVAAFLAKE